MQPATPVFYRDMGSVPLKIVRGEGVYIFDDKGNRFLDGNSSAGVVGIGHGRTEIYKALAAAGDSVTFVYGVGCTHPWQERLAEAVLSISPKNMGAVYFVSGGSEANESALKLVRQYHVERGQPMRYKIIARRQSFHGVTIGALALGARTSWRSIYAPYLFPVTHIDPPYDYRWPGGSLNGPCGADAADELEREICMEGPETVAAFFAEPVMGTTVTGVVPGPDYYRRIREICDQYGILFVADEVLTGYGRTGFHFAIDHWGVEPDIITTGKGIGSGYAPLGAMIVARKVLEPLRSGTKRFNHGFTYSGTPVSCFVGQQVFDIMQRENLFRRSGEVGPYLRQQLDALMARHEIIGQVRGLGLLLGIEFVADRTSKEPFPTNFDLTGRIVRGMRQRNIMIGAGVFLIPTSAEMVITSRSAHLSLPNTPRSTSWSRRWTMSCVRSRRACRRPHETQVDRQARAGARDATPTS